MPIPSNPSVSDIVTEGLKRGGRVSPSAGDITNATNHQFQEVKADIYLKAPQHKSLLSRSIAKTVNGVSRYTLPTACETLRSVQLIDAPVTGDWRGTAQAGGASSITLSTSFSSDETDVLGRFVFITAGTGSGQFGQITAYNNSTKVATLESAWATLDSSWVSPDSTSVYLVESYRTKLWEHSKPYEWDTLTTPFTKGTPTHAALVHNQLWMNYTPDRQYILFYDYWVALDQLDETSAMFVAHMRKFRSLWVQGVAVKTMQRYDEDRYMPELQVYNAMLDLYGGSAANIGQVTYRDV